MPVTNFSQLYLNLLPTRLFLSIVNRLVRDDQERLAEDHIFRMPVGAFVGFKKMLAYFPNELSDAEVLLEDCKQYFPIPQPPVDLFQLAKENLGMMLVTMQSTLTSLVEPKRGIPLEELTPSEIYICGMLAHKAPHRLSQLRDLKAQALKRYNLTETHILKSQYFLPIAFRDPGFKLNSEVTDELLHCCIATGNDEALKRYLKARDNNFLNANVQMLKTLTIAVRYGHYEVLSHVLQHYPEYALYILSAALYYGRYAIAKCALSKDGLDINSTTEVYLYEGKLLFSPILILLEHNKIPTPLKTRFMIKMLLNMMPELHSPDSKLMYILIKLPPVFSQLFMTSGKTLPLCTLNQLPIAAVHHNLFIVQLILDSYTPETTILTVAMQKLLRGFATNPGPKEDAFEIFRLFMLMQSKIQRIKEMIYTSFIELERFKEIVDSLLCLNITPELSNDTVKFLCKTLALGNFRQVQYLIDTGAILRDIKLCKIYPSSIDRVLCSILSHKNSDMNEQELISLLEALGIEPNDIILDKKEQIAEDNGNKHLYFMMMNFKSRSMPLTLSAAGAAALVEPSHSALQGLVSLDPSKVNSNNKRCLEQSSQSYPESKRQELPESALEWFDALLVEDDFTSPARPTLDTKSNASIQALPVCYSSSSGSTYTAYNINDQTMLIQDDVDPSAVAPVMPVTYLDATLPCEKEPTQSAPLQANDTCLSTLSIFSPVQDPQSFAYETCTFENDSGLDNPYEDDHDKDDQLQDADAYLSLYTNNL